jgi:hypothetical protein
MKKAVTEDFELRSGGFLNAGWQCRVRKAEYRPPHPAGTQIFPPSGENGLKGVVPEAVPGEKGGISSVTPGGHADVSDHRWAKVHRQLNG